ncbi:hypothetical protein GCM10023334_012480 [Nonomuraea thailandensis]
MAQRLLYDLHLYPGRQHERGCAVAEVVEPDGWQAGEVGQPQELYGDVLGMQPISVRLGEGEPGVLPCLAQGQLVCPEFDGVAFPDFMPRWVCSRTVSG